MAYEIVTEKCDAGFRGLLIDVDDDTGYRSVLHVVEDASEKLARKYVRAEQRRREAASPLLPPKLKPPHVRVTIASATGETFESFDVRIDEGWKPHKVAAEIRHHIEHAYERTESPVIAKTTRDLAACLMKRSTMERAASFGARFLQTAGEDAAYSRQQLNDLNLAIAMLRHAPVLYDRVGLLCGASEAGDGSDETQARLMRAAEAIRNAVARGTDRKEGKRI